MNNTNTLIQDLYFNTCEVGLTQTQLLDFLNREFWEIESDEALEAGSGQIDEIAEFYQLRSNLFNQLAEGRDFEITRFEQFDEETYCFDVQVK